MTSKEVPLLVSLARERVTYLALELDRSWTKPEVEAPAIWLW
jgi:hypothetical protein